MLGGQNGLHRPALASLLSAMTEAATLDLLPSLAHLLAKLAEGSREEQALQVLFAPSTAFFRRAALACREAPCQAPHAGQVESIIGYAGQLIIGLSRLAWSACSSSLAGPKASDSNVVQSTFKPALLEAWFAFMLQVGRRAPQALEGLCGQAVVMAVTAAAYTLSTHACRCRSGCWRQEQQECMIPPSGLELLAELGSSAPLFNGAHVRTALVSPVPLELPVQACQSLGALGLSGLVSTLEMIRCQASTGKGRLGGASRKNGCMENGMPAVPPRSAIVSAASGILRAVDGAEFESFVKQVADAHSVSNLKPSMIKTSITRPSALHLERLLQHLVGNKSTIDAGS